jgi:hypothetical protein
MSTLGKVLAILNSLAALAFIGLAAMSWGQRQAWSYAVFRHDLLVRGLPVDVDEKDADGYALANNLGADTLNKIFQSAGGQPVKTQVEEVRRRQEQLRGEIEAADEKTQRQKLLEILLPLARTHGERDALRAAKVDELKTKFDDAFKPALEGTEAAEPRRQAIAHLLFNLSPDQEHPRVRTIVGLAAYARAADDQALALADMALAAEADIVKERTTFALNHKPLLQRVTVLAERVAEARQILDDYKTQVVKHQELINARRKDIDDLKAAIADAQAKTTAALAEQGRLEQAYFAAQRAVQDAVDENLQLEKQLRTRERAD